MKPHESVTAMTGAALLAGCAIGPNYKRPDIDTPAQYKEVAAQETPAAPPPAQWWTLFNDSVLNDLESRVEVSNQNLVASEAAYRQALAVVREQRASLFPSISADAGVTKSGGGARGGGTVVTTPGGTVSRTSSGNGAIYQAGAQRELGDRYLGRPAAARSRTRTRSLTPARTISSSPSCRCRRSSRPRYLQLREEDAELRLLNDTVTAYQRALPDRAESLQRRHGCEDRRAAGPDAARERAGAGFPGRADARSGGARHRRAHRCSLPAASLWSRNPIGTRTCRACRLAFLLLCCSDGRTLLRLEQQVVAANASIGVAEAAYFPSLTLNGQLQLSFDVGGYAVQVCECRAHPGRVTGGDGFRCGQDACARRGCAGGV